MRKKCICNTCGAVIVVDYGKHAYCRKHTNMDDIKRSATWWICEDGKSADEPPIDRHGKVWRKNTFAWLVSELNKGELCRFVEDVE